MAVTCGRLIASLRSQSSELSSTSSVIMALRLLARQYPQPVFRGCKRIQACYLMIILPLGAVVIFFYKESSFLRTAYRGIHSTDTGEGVDTVNLFSVLRSV